MQKNLIPIEYACDSNGDHTATIAECTESRIKTIFKNQSIRSKFILECTYIYNLDQIFGVKNIIKLPKSNPVLNCLTNCNI